MTDCTLNDGAAVTDYKYDSYGNIIQKTLPANGKGQRMWYKYRYEPEMTMYVERIDDAWGYRSEQGNFDYLTSGGLGTMGFGLPAAVGAALANPQRKVICFSGDGSLMMNIQEMATAAQQYSKEG